MGPVPRIVNFNSSLILDFLWNFPAGIFQKDFDIDFMILENKGNNTKNDNFFTNFKSNL